MENKHLRLIFLTIEKWKNGRDLSKIRKLQTEFLEAKTTAEIDKIVIDNIDLLDQVLGLWKLVNDAKKRIKNLEEIKIKLTEIIYLN